MYGQAHESIVRPQLSHYSLESKIEISRNTSLPLPRIAEHYHYRMTINNNYCADWERLDRRHGECLFFNEYRGQRKTSLEEVK